MSARKRFTLVFVYLAAVALLHGQDQPQGAAANNTSVPRLMRFNSKFHPTAGDLQPVEGVTFSVYRDQTGGDPLWHELQNVTVDNDGNYTAVLGSTVTGGMPADLFAPGEQRWLGVRFERAGEPEQARVLLVSVPYALKAADADTLGGLPASAYMLDPDAIIAANGASGSYSASGAAVASRMVKAPTKKATSGTAGTIAMFTNATDLGNSIITQTGGSAIGIGTASPGATLDVQSATAGFNTLLNVRQTNTTGVGATGMTLGNQNSLMLMRAYTAGAPGLLANSIGWFALNGSNKLLIGHAGGSAGNDLGFFTNNSWAAPQMVLTHAGNVGIGTTAPAAALDVAGNINLTGSLLSLGTRILGSAGSNVSVGPFAVNPQAGADNTAIGAFALQSFAGPGGGNTAIGNRALENIVTSCCSTAVGEYSLANSTAGANTAIGYYALNGNTTGVNNTAVGTTSLRNTTSGSSNTALGANALLDNTTGIRNTAVGDQALSFVDPGAQGSSQNTGVGASALASQNNSSAGSFNTAVGAFALSGMQGGSSNTAIGTNAMASAGAASQSVAIGHAALISSVGTGNTAVGYLAGENLTNGNGNIYIAHLGVDGESNVTRIGSGQAKFFASGIRGVTTGAADAVAVMIDSNGQLGTASSSRRYKQDIQDMDDASSGLMKLRPVTFHYKQQAADGLQPLEYGLIAEEVEQVYPDLVVHLKNGDVETVQYHKVNAMLLNEVQKQYREIQQLKARLAELSTVEARLAALENAFGMK